MKRRNFLKIGIVGGASVFSAPWTDLLALERPSSVFICKTPTSIALPLSRGSGELAYQGTHILTYGAFQSLASAFNASGKGQMFVAGGGCDDGIAAVKQNRADLGGLCCPVRGTRAEGLPWLQVAWDIKTVITHPSNLLTDISLAKLRAIANGKLSFWNKPLGKRQPVALVVRRHCPDKFEPVRDLLLDGKPSWSNKSLWVETDQQLIDTVARFPGAIGIVSKVFSQPLITEGRLKTLHVDGIPPESEAVSQGYYSLRGPLNLVFKQDRIDAIRPFFNFLYSPEGQEIVSKLLVPIPKSKYTETLISLLKITNLR